MLNIYEFPIFADGARVSCLSWLKHPSELVKYLEKYNINTIYIAPTTDMPDYIKEISAVKNLKRIEFLPFAGGFKTGSLLLISLKNPEYFTKITEWSLGKYGDLTSL